MIFYIKIFHKFKFKRKNTNVQNGIFEKPIIIPELNHLKEKMVYFFLTNTVINYGLYTLYHDKHMRFNDILWPENLKMFRNDCAKEELCYSTLFDQVKLFFH